MQCASSVPVATFDFMPAKSALTPEHPWPGAAAYQAADRNFFHGRKREAEELLRLIQRDIITVVIGAAGVGKTSLIQAGLLPALTEGEWLPIVPKLDWSAKPPVSDAPDITPEAVTPAGNALSRTLVETLIAAAAERQLTSPEPRPGETLWEFFHRAGNRWWSSRQRVVTPIIIIDEVESIFTTAAQNATAERQAAQFLKELSQLAANRPPQRLATRLEKGGVSESAYDFEPVPLRIVLIFREEFASQLGRLRLLFPTLRRSELRLEPFTTSQARDVLMRGAVQENLMSDATLDAVVARLASGRLAAGEVSPAHLSSLAHSLALARKERGAQQITPDFLPSADRKSDSDAMPAASSYPVAETSDLREELESSERKRRSSQRLSLVAVLAAVIAVSAPLVKEQFGTSSPNPVYSDTVPLAIRAASPAPTPTATPEPVEQTPPFENPFSIASPEFLPTVPTKSLLTKEPEPIPPAPIEHAQDDPLTSERSLVTPSPPAPAVSTPVPAASTPRASTPAPGQSTLSPEIQRQLDAATEDRKEQQRREFLRRQENDRRSKTGGSR
jgi:Novel STAND NTPase 1